MHQVNFLNELWNVPLSFKSLPPGTQAPRSFVRWRFQLRQCLAALFHGAEADRAFGRHLVQAPQSTRPEVTAMKTDLSGY